jgi:hypothetical protein
VANSDEGLDDKSGRSAPMRTATSTWPAVLLLGGGAAYLLIIAAGQLRKDNYPLAMISAVAAVACAVLLVRLIQGVRRYLRTQESALSSGASKNKASKNGALKNGALKNKASRNRPASTPSPDSHVRVYAEIMKGRPVAPADRLMAEVILDHRIWRSWKLAVLVIAVPATAWQLYRNGALLADGRGQWLSLAFFAIAAVVIALMVRQQFLLRRWQRRFSESSGDARR